MGLIVNEREVVEVPQLLEACTVNVAIAAAVGVPEIVPVEALSASPAGSEPAVTVQVIGAVPVAVSVCE